MNPTDRPVVAVFGASQAFPGDGHYEAGVDCGRQLAGAGFAVATGGYGGLMEAVCRGAAAAGGATIGVTAPSIFPKRSGANEWVQHEIAADDLIHRISVLTDIAAGYIAMPGSLGTLAELVIAWNLALVAPFSDQSFGPIVTVGKTWHQVVPDLTRSLGATDDLVKTVLTVEEAVTYLTSALAPLR